jgi:hypothetical protein
VERQNIPTVRRVVDELHMMEKSIDDAMRQCASFIVTMIDSAREMQLSATVGHEAYTGATVTLSQLASSRSAVVSLHADLAAIHDDVKLRKVRATGDLWKLIEKPKPSALGASGGETALHHGQLDVAA